MFSFQIADNNSKQNPWFLLHLIYRFEENLIELHQELHFLQTFWKNPYKQSFSASFEQNNSNFLLIKHKKLSKLLV